MSSTVNVGEAERMHALDSQWPNREEEGARQLEALSWRESVARLLLSAILVAFGLYVLANYLRALAWALVLAIALWPLYDRVRQKMTPWAAKEILPIVFTILLGLAVFLPVAVLAVDAVREVRDLIDYARSAEQSGIPVPEFAVRLPYVGQWLENWWGEHLSHAGWAKEIIAKTNTSSLREFGANLGANMLHRGVIFGLSLLTLFFLFRHGESVSAQCRTASQKLFGERGERVALQMVASGTGSMTSATLLRSPERSKERNEQRKS